MFLPKSRGGEREKEEGLQRGRATRAGVFEAAERGFF
jgi:hypothetical protein